MEINKNKHKIPLEHQLCTEVTFTSKYQMPLIQPYLGPIPSEIISFNRARGHAIGQKAIHFYIADAFFECVWNRPDVYLPMLQKCPFVISTDYSLYSDMLLPEVIWNTFRNKLLCSWWQKHGVKVIPNVSWSINSTGIGKDQQAKSLWMQGYEQILKRLEPVHILRYGAMQNGEDTSISTYYKNDNLNGAAYGR